MKVKVISSHNMAGLGNVAEGTVLDLPDHEARHKIAIGYVIAFEDPPAKAKPAATSKPTAETIS